MLIVECIIFLAALYNLFLTGLVLWKTSRQQAGRSFAWFLFWVAVWMLCGVIIMHPDTTRDTVIWTARASTFCATAALISCLWFFTLFPRRARAFTYSAAGLTLLGLPWLFLTWTPQLIAGAGAFPWWQHVATGNWMGYYTAWCVVTFLAGTFHLVRKAHRVRGAERLQVKYTLFGALGTVLISILTNAVIPITLHTSQFAPVGMLSALILSTAVSYAIVRYRLMDIRVVVRTGLVYSVTIGLLSLIFALLVPCLDGFLTGTLHFPSRTGSFLLAFLMALLFQPLQRALQEFLDKRWFFAGVSDYRLTLREACSALAAVNDPRQLSGILLDATLRMATPRRAGIYLGGKDGAFTLSAAGGERGSMPQAIAANDALIYLAAATDDVLLTEEMLHEPGARERLGRQLLQWEVYLAVPLITGQTLFGVMLLGEKASEDIYPTDAIGLLRILGKQTAIALEKAHHYEEQALLNEYHARLLHVMQDGVIALDPEGRITTFNPTAARITGITADAALGQPLHAVGLGQLPSYSAGRERLEIQLNTPGGQIPVLATITPFLRRWDIAHSHLLIVHDLSALRALEKEKMLAERYSSMGALAASLAQEIQIPLAPIRNFAGLLREQFDDRTFRQEFSTVVGREVHQINRLVGEMLSLVRKPTTERALVDPRKMLESLLRLVTPECEQQRIHVCLAIDEDVPPVQGVSGQLYQAVLNTLIHAIQAAPHEDELAIALLARGKEVICRITSACPGLPVEEVSRLFARKTGAAPHDDKGLELVAQFIEAHNGRVWAEAQPGARVAIHLALPAWQPAEG